MKFVFLSTGPYFMPNLTNLLISGSQYISTHRFKFCIIFSHRTYMTRCFLMFNWYVLTVFSYQYDKCVNQRYFYDLIKCLRLFFIQVHIYVISKWKQKLDIHKSASFLCIILEDPEKRSCEIKISTVNVSFTRCFKRSSSIYSLKIIFFCALENRKTFFRTNACSKISSMKNTQLKIQREYSISVGFHEHQSMKSTRTQPNMITAITLR